MCVLFYFFREKNIEFLENAQYLKIAIFEKNLHSTKIKNKSTQVVDYLKSTVHSPHLDLFIFLYNTAKQTKSKIKLNSP